MNGRRWGLWFAALAVMSGCAGSTDLIRKSSISSRSDVMQEIADNAPPPKGYAELRIASSLKTHPPGAYACATDRHGTPEYTLLLNVDGQALKLQGTLRSEGSAEAPRNPEAGHGVRYSFAKNLRLKAGTHRIVIAVPADDVVVEREIRLAEGTRNSLILEPDYNRSLEKRRPGFPGATSFRHGLKGLQIVFNGARF